MDFQQRQHMDMHAAAENDTGLAQMDRWDRKRAVRQFLKAKSRESGIDSFSDSFIPPTVLSAVAFQTLAVFHKVGSYLLMICKQICLGLESTNQKSSQVDR